MWYPLIFLLGRLTKQSAIALASLITGTTLPSLAVLTLASFLAKSTRPRHVAPLCASGLGYPNAAGVGSYGGQYLYLGPVGVADRHS